MGVGVGLDEGIVEVKVGGGEYLIWDLGLAEAAEESGFCDSGAADGAEEGVDSPGRLFEVLEELQGEVARVRGLTEKKTIRE